MQSIITTAEHYTPEQVALIKSQVAPNANDNELKLFLYQCKRTGLDPLVRQIYCIHRGGKMTIQTSIDGFRVIAERSGNYAGQGEPEFTEDNGKIICCKVRVYKFSANGVRYEAAVGVAYWDEFAQTSPLWTKMRHTMISKCAEAIALRKAFPQDLSGLYTTEEMQQADTPTVELETREDCEVTDQEKQYLSDLLETSSYEEKVRKGLKVTIHNMLTREQFEKAKAKLLDSQVESQNMGQKEINQKLAFAAK